MPSVYETSAELTTLPIAIAQQFNFTEAESDLCLGLVQGKSLDDIADEYQQPRDRLRHRLHSLLIKTGTDNEAKLVTVVLSSPAL